MTLFIPRKQSMVSSAEWSTSVIEGFGDPIPSSQDKTGKTGWSVDKEHLEKVLSQNFHAIENWANQRAVSATVSGSTNETLTNAAITNLSFDTKAWDYNAIASTSGQYLKVPAPGIYIVSAGVAFSQIPGQTHLLIAMSPGSYPQQDGFINGSTADQWVSTFGGHVQLFKGGEQLKIYASATMPSSTSILQMRLMEFSLTKLFDKPSPVQ